MTAMPKAVGPFETLTDFLAAGAGRRSNGIAPTPFYAADTSEPSVIGWTPAASVYFRDPSAVTPSGDT
jgi:hypothetical protein